MANFAANLYSKNKISYNDYERNITSLRSELAELKAEQEKYNFATASPLRQHGYGL
jgi:hypothetical protein